jgi:hypothetical protein
MLLALTVYGLDGALPPQMLLQPVALATTMRSPNICVSSFTYGVSPQPCSQHTTHFNQQPVSSNLKSILLSVAALLIWRTQHIANSSWPAPTLLPLLKCNYTHLAGAAELHEWRLELAAAHGVLVKQVAPVGQALHEVPVGRLWRQHLRDGLRLERVVGAYVHAQLAASAVHRRHLRSSSGIMEAMGLTHGTQLVLASGLSALSGHTCTHSSQPVQSIGDTCAAAAAAAAALKQWV